MGKSLIYEGKWERDYCDMMGRVFSFNYADDENTEGRSLEGKTAKFTKTFQTWPRGWFHIP